MKLSPKPKPLSAAGRGNANSTLNYGTAAGSHCVGVRLVRIARHFLSAKGSDDLAGARAAIGGGPPAYLLMFWHYGERLCLHSKFREQRPPIL